MSVLASAVEESRLAERRRALRALLAQPVLSARGPDEADFRRVRRFEAELREWLDVNTGWRLTVDASAARLHKRVAGDDATRGIVDHRRRPFTRRRYVLLALALAVLERFGGQITLGRLAEDVIGELGDPRFASTGIEFALAGRDERGDIVAVVRLLLALGALRRIEGDEERFVEAGTDVLYDVEHGVVGVMLQTAQAPSMTLEEAPEARLSAVVEQPFVDTDDARTRALRRIITRRLLDDPVLEYASLTDDELAYLTSQRRAITDRITEATGLVPEVRAEGIAMLDPDDQLTDVRMPEGGAPGHLALLIATRLAEEGHLTRDALIDYTDELCQTHASVWGSTIRARPRAELADEAIGRLRALGLLRVEGDEVAARPILSRFRLGQPVTIGAGV
ncbi:TIGR02678 family protein [Leucobacter sp. wl10]|uniref:TIGR02678 family protein n=1 Tax=Leucobacter sp. wl10 TaxID=2304677 RepID=UPI000E5C30B8|nr:TIGR02678 family protein [Leucobacter sp. wl10]RGE19249.1 TIGR02678 family protein [Leucobacter sp. wl10]